jgi:hypothetical protein
MSLPARRTSRTTLAITATLPLLLATAGWSQGLPPIQREFSNGATLRFYGQINKGVLNYDDGIDSETYGLIDNDNSSTRAGLRYQQDFGAWHFENVNEFDYAPFSTDNTSIIHQSPDAADWEFNNDNIRKIDFTLQNDSYGKIWLGQGSMATDGVYEMDLSGTTVIDYSSVADSASAQIIRFRDPGLDFDESLSGITIGNAFTNYDGPRRVRIRYDTPAFNGFTFAAAYGRNLLSDNSEVRDENIFDASVTYGNTFNDVEVKGGLGYYWEEDDTRNWGGSVSALHTPTGLNATLSVGGQDTDGGGGTYWYGKLGLLRDFASWGATATAIDYYSGDDIFLDSDAGINSSSSDSLGVSLVQNIDRANTELWLTYRTYDYSDNVASYEDGQAIFGGARFKF